MRKILEQKCNTRNKAKPLGMSPLLDPVAFEELDMLELNKFPKLKAELFEFRVQRKHLREPRTKVGFGFDLIHRT
jgi:hypothetical protein